MPIRVTKLEKNVANGKRRKNAHQQIMHITFQKVFLAAQIIQYDSLDENHAVLVHF